eukprot:scaffold9610_cov110-Isochrysis_galbana.AAC.4
MIGHAPGETVKVKGGREKGGNASLPGDNRVSRRIRPLALLILFFWLERVVAVVTAGRSRRSEPRPMTRPGARRPGPADPLRCSAAPIRARQRPLWPNAAPARAPPRLLLRFLAPCRSACSV